ncbi:MAG: hypothetical protein EBY66_00995 [Candidatus Fonsibacter lacus]|nr:hypothetical protein [Candidatus Fonsibacter lacus]
MIAEALKQILVGVRCCDCLGCAAHRQDDGDGDILGDVASVAGVLDSRADDRQESLRVAHLVDDRRVAPPPADCDASR